MDLPPGLMMAPLVAFGMLLRDTGPAKAFIAAGAVDPDHARRPRSIGVDSERAVADAVRRGVLVATGDGRFWVRVARHRRRRAATWSFVLAVWAIAVAVAVVLWLRTRG